MSNKNLKYGISSNDYVIIGMNNYDYSKDSIVINLLNNIKKFNLKIILILKQIGCQKV